MNEWPSSSFDKNAQPVAPPRINMSSQLVWLQTSKLCGRTGALLRRTRAPMIHAAAARKRGGQGDRPSSALVIRWIGPRIAKSKTSPTMRASARRFMRTAGALSIAVERDAVKLHPMVDEAEAELLGNSLLQRLELIVDELDHISGFDVDQM